MRGARGSGRLGAIAILALGTSVLGFASPAFAGARPHAFVQGTDALPPSGLEWENWFGVASPRDGDPEWEWWTGAVDGVSSRVETGLFAVLAQPQTITTSGAAGMSLSSVRGQLSWQPVDHGEWPVDLRVRGELGIPIAGEQITTLWLEALGSRDFGPVKLIANAGAFTELSGRHGTGHHGEYWLGGAGASVDAGLGLRLGGELYGEGSTRESHDHAWIAGPSIAWGRGRVWMSGTWAVGLDHDSPARDARLVLGLVL